MHPFFGGIMTRTMEFENGSTEFAISWDRDMESKVAEWLRDIDIAIIGNNIRITFKGEGSRVRWFIKPDRKPVDIEVETDEDSIYLAGCEDLRDATIFLVLAAWLRGKAHMLRRTDYDRTLSLALRARGWYGDPKMLKRIEHGYKVYRAMRRRYEELRDIDHEVTALAYEIRGLIVQENIPMLIEEYDLRRGKKVVRLLCPMPGGYLYGYLYQRDIVMVEAREDRAILVADADDIILLRYALGSPLISLNGYLLNKNVAGLNTAFTYAIVYYDSNEGSAIKSDNDGRLAEVITKLAEIIDDLEAPGEIRTAVAALMTVVL